MKSVYRVRYPFSNGDYYIERLDGKRSVGWVLIGDIPTRLKHMLSRPGHKMESASFRDRKQAQFVAMELRLEEAIQP